MINFFFSSSYTDMNIHEDTSTEDENNMEKKKENEIRSKGRDSIAKRGNYRGTKRKKNYMASIKIKKDRLPYRLK